jgi:hypothetical protein
METLHIRLIGERALFRNIGIPGADVADTALNRRHRAIHGILGNLLGLWRDFDNQKDFDLAPELKQWLAATRLTITKIEYPQHPEIRIIGQHRYKGISDYTKSGNSGPKFLSYHWNVQMDFYLEITEKGAEQLKTVVRKPVGIPYLGQSNCPAQIFLVVDK